MRGEFVDTNVVVYAHDATAGEKRERAAELILNLARERRGLLSVQVLMEFVVTVTRKIPRPLSPEEAAQVVDDFSTWNVYCPAAADVGRVTRLSARYEISLWDAMIIHAAAQMDAAIVWSEDLNHGQAYEGVVVRNPFR
jgi:predicted nucleic acid-binding protein